jgi:hypothetical protein
MRPRKKIRDAILGHVASWGDRIIPMCGITAKTPSAVNAVRAAVRIHERDRKCFIPNAFAQLALRNHAPSGCKSRVYVLNCVESKLAVEPCRLPSLVSITGVERQASDQNETAEIEGDRLRLGRRPSHEPSKARIRKARAGRVRFIPASVLS